MVDTIRAIHPGISSPQQYNGDRALRRYFSQISRAPCLWVHYLERLLEDPFPNFEFCHSYILDLPRFNKYNLNMINLLAWSDKIQGRTFHLYLSLLTFISSSPCLIKYLLRLDLRVEDRFFNILFIHENCLTLTLPDHS